MTIRARLILIMLAAVILPMLITTLIAIREFRIGAEQEFRANAQQQMGQISKTFDTFLTGLAQSVAFFASSEAILDLDSSLTTYEGETRMMNPAAGGLAEQRAYALMEAFGKQNPNLAYVYVGLETGGFAQYPSTDLGNYNPTRRPWYKAAEAAPGKPLLGDPYADIITGNPMYPSLHTFTTKSGLKGVFGMDMSLAKLTEIVQTVHFGEKGYLILIEGKGVVLADPTTPANNFKAVSTLGAEYQGMVSGALDRVEMADQSWLVSRYQDSTTGWTLLGLIPESEVFAAANTFQLQVIMVALVVIAAFAAVGVWFSNLIANPIAVMTRRMEEIANGEGDLTRRLPEAGSDELSQMARSFNRFVAMIHQLVQDITRTSQDVSQQAGNGVSIANEMAKSSQHQTEIMEQVATSFNEMVSTTTDVARSCTETAASAQESRQYVYDGKRYIDSSVAAVQSLTSGIEDSNQAMKALAEESRNITSILDTIRGIAEQTNLLALNAAIEAARAGEQGRGFAVVADEVRTLAGRTADSTAEIDSMIASLVTRTASVASKLDSTLQHSGKTMSATEQTRQVFEFIESSVSRIHDMTQQIAAAAEEQQQVSVMINRNITDVNGETTATHNRAMSLNRDASELNRVADKLRGTVSRFRI